MGLFKHLVNEGIRLSFYLVMMPFAKMGFSAFFMQIVCWASMCCAVFLLLQFSPFNGFAKFAVITSAGFLYFFSGNCKELFYNTPSCFCTCCFVPES